MTLEPRRTGGAWESALFVSAVFASAFLIFLVQPIVGKRILPWFGGAAGVWMLCLAFYQTMLFLGYAYAHGLIRLVSPGLQLAIHAGAVGLAILALPVLPGDAWRPNEGADPSGRILTMLSVNVAIPFLVLASTGPLVQAWFARRFPTRSPYPLYACSNAGSLAALLAYPFALEPHFPLPETGRFWSFAFVASALAVLGCAALAWQRGREASPAHPPDDARTHAGRSRGALWFGLSGTAVVLLMGVTNELTIDIASVPFLWIIPLSIYLLTFVVCFASESFYRRAPTVLVALLALIPSVGLGVWSPWLPAPGRMLLNAPLAQIASYCVLLLAVCTVLHGELYRLRPPAASLTAYYLAISAGGAAGGIFVGIVAPQIFSDHHEIAVGLALAGLLLLALCRNDAASFVHASAPRGRRIAVVASALLLLGYTGWSLGRPDPERIHQERSFFGVHRVFETGNGDHLQRSLRNGSTVHGVQLLVSGRRLPTSYYGRATGLGLVLAPHDHAGARIGVVGLGIGTLAAYARAGEYVRFYEIDPVVVRIARDDGHFHFLGDSEAEVEIVVGDGRLSLAREQDRGEAQTFDYLIIDAFNSDAIPVHLLTLEAFARYVAALAPDGLLGVHCSSRHFDLMNLVARAGLELGLHPLQIVNQRAAHWQSKPSQWVWLGRDPAAIDALEKRVRQRHANLRLAPNALRLTRPDLDSLRQIPVWTDDYSDLFGLLRRR